MDFGSFIDGIKILKNLEQLPNNVLEKEIQFFTHKVKSVNTFTNFSEYSVEARTHKLLSYLSRQLNTELNLNNEQNIFQCINLFLAQCLRGEYFIEFSNINKKETQALFPHKQTLGKFIYLSNESKKMSLVGTNKSTILSNIASYIGQSVKKGINAKIIFQGSCENFFDNFDIILPANRIGAICIEYDSFSHSLIAEILEQARRKKSFFCNVVILFDVKDLDQIIKLKDYYSNYVKILKVNQSLILNTQLG